MDRLQPSRQVAEDNGTAFEFPRPQITVDAVRPNAETRGLSLRCLRCTVPYGAK